MLSKVALCLYGFVLISSVFFTDNGGVSAASLIVKRQVYGNIRPGGAGGVEGILGYRREIFNNNKGKTLTGFAQVSKNFFPNEKPVIGAGLDFKAPRGSISVGAQRQPGAGTGTSVQATANVNLLKSKNGRTSLDANANWAKTFGGQSGNSKPTYGAGLSLIHKF